MEKKAEFKPIAEAIVGIMRNVGPIGKEGVNKMQGFKFRGIDDVMNHLNPVMATHGVFILPEVLEERTEERVTNKGSNLIYRILKMKYTFVSGDGSSLSCSAVGEAMDSGDKAANKAMAVALKYALSQALMLAYDIIDPDAETHAPSKPVEPKSEPKNFKFLKAMETMKKSLGNELYYKVLNANGYEKSTEVRGKDEQIYIYSLLKKELENKVTEEMNNE